VVGACATSRRLLERRLVMIMQGRTPLRLTLAGLCTIALVAAATLPAWATSPQVPSPQPPSAMTPPSAPTPQAAPPTAGVPQTPPPAQAPPPQPPPRPQATMPPVVRTPPPRLAIKVEPHLVLDRKVVVTVAANLTDEGRALVEALDKEHGAILEEAERQVAQRREATIKALQAL